MSDIKVATALFSTDSAVLDGGTQDLTIAGLGWTPKAVIFIAGTAEGSTNPQGDWSYSFGAATGATEEWAGWGLLDDNGSVQESRRNLFSDKCIYVSRLADGSSPRINSSFNSFISNGVRINHVTSPSTDARFIGIFFGGADLQAHADRVPLGTGTSAIDVTAPGFEPTAVIFSSTGDDAADGIGTFFVPSFAFAQNQTTDTEKLLAFSADDSLSEGLTEAILNDGLVGRQGVSGAWTASISDYDSSGFSITPSSSAGGDDLPYLALDTGDRSIYVDIIDGPTSAASDWTVSTGFEPQAVVLTTTMLQNTETINSNADAGTLGFSAFDGSREASIHYSNEFNAATMNTASGFQSKGLYLLEDDGATVAFDASSPSFISTGFEFTAANINTAQATARKFIVFAVEAEDTGITGSGDLISDDSTADGTGEITKTGSGTPTSDASTMSGSGSVEGAITGEGDLFSGNSTTAGTAEITKTGSGTLVSDDSTISGSGNVGEAITGSGTLESDDSTLSGTAERVIAGSGTLQSDDSTLSGTGERVITAQVFDLFSGNSTMDGEAGKSINGSGDMESGDSTMDGGEEILDFGTLGAFLLVQNGLTGHIDDRLRQFLVAKGFTDDLHNYDLFDDYLLSLGFTDEALWDKYYDATKDGFLWTQGL